MFNIGDWNIVTIDGIEAYYNEDEDKDEIILHYNKETLMKIRHDPKGIIFDHIKPKTCKLFLKESEKTIIVSKYI